MAMIEGGPWKKNQSINVLMLRMTSWARDQMIHGLDVDCDSVSRGQVKESVRL